ncbi:MAG: NAD(P)/FAD-dependent oxidoreductase [Gammaproteobacteria bacterium]|nr:NAD(P)/FAD-dependent oxidoreductase [Gammaproteobacteria bacterium]
MNTLSSQRISIIGAGFAALTAAKELRKRLPSADITLIAPAPEFIYYPSLIWVPTGLRSGDDLRFDLRPWLTQHKLNFHAGRVTGLGNGGRTVLTDSGEIQNDALLIASGGRFIKKLPGIEHTLTVCEGISAAQAMRERLQTMQGGTIAIGFGTNPNEQGAMRGGPMFELLFGIDAWLRQQGRRKAFELVFFNAATEPGKRLGEKAVKGMLQQMASREITTRLGHKPQGFETDGVLTDKGKIPADLILFMPGMTGPDWAANTGFTLSAGGFFQADAQCRVTNAQGVYVAGDAGSYPGPDWLPKQAHLADLQAKAAAQNIVAELQGRTPAARFTPELICIVDTFNSGMLVFRNESRSLVLPPMRIFHWAKRVFEWLYLRSLRK